MKTLFKSLIAVVFVLSITSLSFGQMSIGFNGIGAKVGFAGPESGIGNTIIFGGLVDLGNITDAIGLGAFVDFWSKSEGASGGDVSAEVDFSALTVAAMGFYHFPGESSMNPYVAAGVGFTRAKGGFSFDLGEFGSGSASVSSTELSISVAGGLDYELSPKATGRAEFKYNLGGWDYWAITGGVILKMGGE